MRIKVYRHEKRGTLYTMFTKASLAISLTHVEEDEIKFKLYLDVIGVPTIAPMDHELQVGEDLLLSDIRFQKSTEGELLLGTEIFIYVGTDGQVWARSKEEFNDGRFQVIL